MVIQMYADDHPGLHFHIRYEGRSAASYYLRSGRLIVRDRRLPMSQANAVRRWADLHRDELLENWERLERRESAVRISPLR